MLRMVAADRWRACAMPRKSSLTKAKWGRKKVRKNHALTVDSLAFVFQKATRCVTIYVIVHVRNNSPMPIAKQTI